MRKLSNTERAMVLKSWAIALKEGKTSEWAKTHLPASIEAVIAGYENNFISLSLDGDAPDVIALSVHKIHRDDIELLVYVPESGNTDIISLFRTVRGMSILEPIEDSGADDFVSKMEPDSTATLTTDGPKCRLLNKMSKAYLGCYVFEEIETHKLELLSQMKLRSTMKA